jgi:hypothetical protein
MATFDYSRSQATADRLIAKFGQPGTIRRPGAASGDPWNPTIGPATDYPCTLVVLDYTAREIDGTLILASDRKVYVATAGLDVTPEPSDQVVVGSEVLSIVNVGRLAPAGVDVFFLLQARG